LGDPLGNAYPRWLAFRRHRDSRQYPLAFLIAPHGRQTFRTTNHLKVAAEKSLCIGVKWNATSFARLATAYRNGATFYIKVSQLQIAGLLHTEPRIDEQRQ
jgi:hypothetical protein